MKKNKFVVFYGINNLGKSTQIGRVRTRFNLSGLNVGSIKYPIYTMAPTGPIINAYLRPVAKSKESGEICLNPNGLSSREVQILYAMNRTHYAPILEKRIKENDILLSEDYSGTSLAWGAGAGVDIDFLIEINSHLREPDLAILFDGERFTDGIEEGHKHETDNDLTSKVKQFHLDLAERFEWQIINANRSEEIITEEIVDMITQL